MKSHYAALSIVLVCGSALAQTKQTAALYDQQSSPLHLSIEPPNLSTPTAAPVIPPGTPDRFNEGLFTAKEQVHDEQIAGLTIRVSSLEGHSNFIDGAMWAIGILFVVTVGLLKLFWKGFVKVILAQADVQPMSPPATHS
jgi:hypothetical protein